LVAEYLFNLLFRVGNPYLSQSKALNFHSLNQWQLVDNLRREIKHTVNEQVHLDDFDHCPLLLGLLLSFLFLLFKAHSSLFLDESVELFSLFFEFSQKVFDLTIRLCFFDTIS